MRNVNYFRNKKVAVVGLARSGEACASLLSDLGAKIAVTDSRDNESLRSAALRLKPKNIKVELGRHTQEFIRGKDVVIVSPGVEDTSPAVIWANQFKIPVISEIEAASILNEGQIIAVTGSNGKTTVTTLIGNILQASGRMAWVCGNIGNPFSAEVNRIKKGDFVSLEISSFQLEKTRAFKPKIAVILNFTANHLDRYKDTGEYLEAKKRIFMNQDKNDFLVINKDTPVLKKAAREANSRVLYFSKQGSLNHNQAAVTAVASILGINRDLCLKVLREFKGIPHRMEEVAAIRQVRFINDSKATTVDSAIWALNNIREPVILIAGGKDKGLDYRQIIPSAKDKVREVILIGQAKEKIAHDLGDALPLTKAKTLEEAVHAAYQKARQGDCVLLSPMCSSFDMFRDYEERGSVFKRIVNDLSKAKVKTREAKGNGPQSQG